MLGRTRLDRVPAEKLTEGIDLLLDHRVGGLSGGGDIAVGRRQVGQLSSNTPSARKSGVVQPDLLNWEEKIQLGSKHVISHPIIKPSNTPVVERWTSATKS